MRIGVSKPKFAKYNEKDGVVTYSNGGTIGRLVNINLSIESSGDNAIFTDNGPECADNTFAGGTLTMGTNDLTFDVSKAILGVKSRKITGIDGLDEDAEELVYDNSQESPYLGVGFVVKHRNKQGTFWRAIVLRKVQFGIPADAVNTQGKTIEWQTPELSAEIFRDDTAAEEWKTEAFFTTEAMANKYVCGKLNITEETSPTEGE